MIVDLQSIGSDFRKKVSTIAGEECTLVTPNDMGCNWTSDNLHFRSSIWNSSGELISASYKKFFNWNESALTPPPQDWNKVKLLDKADGSTLIVSKYKGQLITRVRNTFDLEMLPNKDEVYKLFPSIYPLAFDNSLLNSEEYTLLFEWCSPTNRIVLYYEKPQLFLTGVIRHSDYSMLSQSEVDMIAQTISVPRPKVYSFVDAKTMVESVQDMTKVEGICVYYNDGQNILKVKCQEYLDLHKLKGRLCSLNSLLNYWYEKNRPNYLNFYETIKSEIDWETAEQHKSNISLITNTNIELDQKLEEIHTFVKKHLIDENVDRKSAAIEIQCKYSGPWTGVAFNFLTGKCVLDARSHRKLIDYLIQERKSQNEEDSTTNCRDFND